MISQIIHIMYEWSKSGCSIENISPFLKVVWILEIQSSRRTYVTTIRKSCSKSWNTFLNVMDPDGRKGLRMIPLYRLCKGLKHNWRQQMNAWWSMCIILCLVYYSATLLSYLFCLTYMLIKRMDSHCNITPLLNSFYFNYRPDMR